MKTTIIGIGEHGLETITRDIALQLSIGAKSCADPKHHMFLEEPHENMKCGMINYIPVASPDDIEAVLKEILPFPKEKIDALHLYAYFKDEKDPNIIKLSDFVDEMLFSESVEVGDFATYDHDPLKANEPAAMRIWAFPTYKR